MSGGARFRVVQSFPIRSQRLWVIAGEIVDGLVKPGMELTLSDGSRDFRVPIHSIEFLDSLSRGESHLALTIFTGERDWDALINHAFSQDDVVVIHPDPGRYRCPCCGLRTLNEAPPGSHAVCEVCWWEDDRTQFDDPDYEGGANRVSLRRAARNYQTFGASERRFIETVRKPRQDEAAK